MPGLEARDYSLGRDVEHLVESTIRIPCKNKYGHYTEIRHIYKKPIDATCLRINKQFQ
jgi:hypothetical protein